MVGGGVIRHTKSVKDDIHPFKCRIKVVMIYFGYFTGGSLAALVGGYDDGSPVIV